MPLIATKGAASVQGFGEFAQAAAPVYIEDVFSTWLYSGTGSAQTITNNIDLSTKGGLVWGKMRNDSGNHFLQDTVRGTGQSLTTNNTDGNISVSQYITAFNNNGFTLGTNLTVNGSTYTYVSWTFREQPKFFDVVTYTGNGTAGRTISHNLGSVPGFIIVKCTSTTSQWAVYHRSLGNTTSVYLNSTIASFTADFWNNTTPTSTGFTVPATFPNNNGDTYVAYLFAHDAGGFGLTGSDNVISCGSYTGNGGTQSINLGYEPQWLLIKRTTNADTNTYWPMEDVMRGGLTANGNVLQFRANSSAAEDALGGVTTGPRATATGFEYVSSGLGAYNASGENYIYIAIRRGPMKTPTSGTSVFAPLFNTQSTGTQNTTNFTVDTMFIRSPGGGENNHLVSRLQGVSTNTTDSGQYMYTQSSAAEASGGITRFWSNIGFQTTSGYSGYAAIYLPFQRAPGFHDVVCFTSNGSAGATFSHNLAAVPELLIVKSRGASGDWYVFGLAVGSNASGQWYMKLNLTDALTGYAALTTNTASSVTISNGTLSGTNTTNVAYLFASVSGVSKVGSYTGTGTTNQINCGFTGGARLIIIKRTDSTGDWYVYNSASGIVAGNDPYILLNSTAAEVTNTDYVDTYSAGFELSSTAPAGLNANGGTYIFLAIA